MPCSPQPPWPGRPLFLTLGGACACFGPAACRCPQCGCSSNPVLAAPLGGGPPWPAPKPAVPYRGFWQRGTRGPQAPAGVAAPAIAAPHTLTFTLWANGRPAVVLEPAAESPAAPPRDYSQALRASLRRETIAAAQLLELAAAPDADDCGSPRLHQQLQCQLGGPGRVQAFQDAMQLAVPSADAIDAVLDKWQVDARHQAPQFERQYQLRVGGVADAAVVSRGGRSRGQCKAANQDAFVACATACPDGTAPALLLGVFDGHGSGGEAASQTAAGGLAGALPSMRLQLMADAGLCSGGSSSGSSCSGGNPPVAQQALVKAFQAVAASMRYDSDFADCGAAGVACLVEENSITAVWAGDCRAVVGLSVDTTLGPSVLVHSLTQDHKPSSPLERARISASRHGRVVQLRPGRSHRLCGGLCDSTLLLSRAFGDAWAVPLGLTAEPDAVTVTLPPPTSTTCTAGSSASPRCPLDSLVSSSISTDGDDSMVGGPARHVLVLGSDGLWDMLGNADAVAIAISCASAGSAADALLHAAQRKWAAAFAGASSDDITVAVAFLPA